MFKEKYGGCSPREEMPTFDTIVAKREIDRERYHRDYKQRKGVGSLIIGIIGLFAWYYPYIGLPVGIVGLIFAINGIKHNKSKAMSIVGLVFSSICVFMSVLVFVLAILMLMNKITIPSTY